MSNKGPIVALLAFKTVSRDIAVLAGNSVFRSMQCVDDPQYIVVPAVLHLDVFIYYSFAGEPLRLYRLKRNKAYSPNAKRTYRVCPSTGCRKYDIKELLLEYGKNLVSCG